MKIIKFKLFKNIMKKNNNKISFIKISKIN